MSFISEPSSLSRSSSQPLSQTNRGHEVLTRTLPWKSSSSHAHSLPEEVLHSMATRGAQRDEACSPWPMRRTSHYLCRRSIKLSFRPTRTTHHHLGFASYWLDP